MKFPAECPAFEFSGKVYEGFPGAFVEDGDRYFVIGENVGWWGPDTALVCFGFAAKEAHRVKPLTKAAKNLIKWVKA